MCEPTTILAVASAVSAGVGAYGQRQSAKAQQQAVDQQRQAQAEEIAAKRDQTIGQRVAAARREAARRLVAAGEAGVGGQSAALDVAETFGRANRDAAVTAKQAGFEDRASAANYASELAQIRKPSVLESGLQIAQGYAGGAQLGGQISDAWAKTRNSLTVRGGRS